MPRPPYAWHSKELMAAQASHPKRLRRPRGADADCVALFMTQNSTAGMSAPAIMW